MLFRSIDAGAKDGPPTAGTAADATTTGAASAGCGADAPGPVSDTETLAMIENATAGSTETTAGFCGADGAAQALVAGRSQAARLAATAPVEAR